MTQGLVTVRDADRAYYIPVTETDEEGRPTALDLAALADDLAVSRALNMEVL